MTGWVKVMLADLARPDGQPRDWYGWATNQSGHVLLGILLTWAAMLAGVPAFAAALCMAAAYAGKEAGDLRRGGKLRDGLTDVGFVTAGAWLALTMAAADPFSFAMAVLAVAAGLLHGIRRRILARSGE